MLEGKTLEQLNELEQNLNQNIERMETYLKTIEDYLSELSYLAKRKEDLWSEFHRTVKEKLQASDLISEIQEKKGRLKTLV